MGERLVVQFARGSRRNEPFSHQERPAPRPRRTAFRMTITGLPAETSWQVSISPCTIFPDVDSCSGTVKRFGIPVAV
jgi:hypothetical protein